MIWYILLILFSLLLLWILLGPVILIVNTEQYRYQIMLPGVVQASVVSSDGLPTIKGWIFFIPFRFNPFSIKGQEKKKEKRKKRKKENALRRLKKSRKRIGNMGMFKDALGAFWVRKLNLDLDTDDFMMNAWLIPAFSALNNGRNVQMQINFEGHMFLDLDLRTRLASLVWILIKNR